MCLSGRSLLEEVYDYDFFLTNTGIMLMISSASPVAGPVLHPPPPPPPSEGGGVGAGPGGGVGAGPGGGVGAGTAVTLIS